VAGWVAIISALAGFVFELSFRSSREVNGVQVECSYFDLGPFVVAVVCLVAGIKCLGNRGRPNRSMSLETVAAVIGLAGAAVHLLRGVLITAGAIGPCG
jgi:nitrate/nitrite transporter NarK